MRDCVSSSSSSSSSKSAVRSDKRNHSDWTIANLPKPIYLVVVVGERPGRKVVKEFSLCVVVVMWGGGRGERGGTEHVSWLLWSPSVKGDSGKSWFHLILLSIAYHLNSFCEHERSYHSWVPHWTLLLCYMRGFSRSNPPSSHCVSRSIEM